MCLIDSIRADSPVTSHEIPRILGMVMYGAVEEEAVEMDNHMEPHFGHEHRLCNVGMQTVPVEN
ncbi:hypothetical protein DPMN_052081 [Dreissena polymorpha]|uniref:Uncharacterized protein n=1 Tax=Dreissena polymorpha TaxID=45954 RepID=A0A9D4HQX3_DREPO|nr:hypothetical protein DPMN_052081 [Dreissena polymorpha]